MTLARFGFVISIPMLLVGNPEAVNNTMALVTNTPIQANETGMSLTRRGNKRGSRRRRRNPLPRLPMSSRDSAAFGPQDGGTGARWLGPQGSSDPLRQHAIFCRLA